MYKKSETQNSTEACNKYLRRKVNNVKFELIHNSRKNAFKI